MNQTWCHPETQERLRLNVYEITFPVRTEGNSVSNLLLSPNLRRHISGLSYDRMTENNRWVRHELNVNVTQDFGQMISSTSDKDPF